VAILLGLWRRKLTPRLPWCLFALGAAFSVVADISWSIVETRLGEVPTPSPIDALYLAFYPLLTIGLLLLVRRREPRGQWMTVIDATIVAAAAGLVIWTLVRPSVLASDLSLTARVVNLLYPLADLGLLVMVLRLAMGPGVRSAAFRLLIGSMVLTAVADLVFLVATLQGTFESGGPMDVLWPLGYLAFGAAALHPSAAQLGESGPTGRRQLGPGRVAMLAGSLLAVPVVLVVGVESPHLVDAVIFAIGATAVCALLLVRVVLLVRQLESSIARERILRAESVSLVTAESVADVERIVVDSAHRLTDDQYHVVIDPDGDLVGRAVLSERENQALIPITGDQRRLMIVTGVRPIDPYLLSSLRTLAGTAALAFDSVARDARRIRDEQRFRAIVRASSDLMVLVRADGVISWCGDSVERICGYRASDLVGRRLDSLLHPDEAEAFGYLAEAMAKPGPAPVRIDARLRLSDGSFRIFQFSGQNMLSEPAVASLVITGLDVTERRVLADQLTAKVLYDDLTRLPNRALLLDRLGQALARHRRGGEDATLLLVGLDGFKAVNDSLGHEAGDQLLVQATKRLLDPLRAVDTAARLGGDEFAVLAGNSGADHVMTMVRALLNAMSAPFLIGDREVFVSASIGIVAIDDQHDDPESLLRDANIAMRRAKAAGKNQAKAFRPSMYVDAVQRLELSGDLQRALERGELIVHYQPIVELTSGRPRSFEALVRWAHPAHGLVRPTQFIPLAEETGLVVPLGRWVLREACRQAVSWQEKFGEKLTMAVNISARHLVDDTALVDVDDALRLSGLEPECLTVEITESALMADLDLAASKLHTLRGRGVRVAIDDFGTGYSSLSYLDRLPIDIIKIDRSFVSPLDDPERDPALLRVMVDLAQRLDIPIVAEGIENDAQLQRLVELGCPLGQGYLFSQPHDPLTLERALSQSLMPVG
jgi:diguanylate cyclase (GGDEF)-like protein/PAS domain S-box-containing protein